MIKVKFDDAALQKAFAELETLGASLTPALKLIGRKLVESTEQRFIDKKGPEGTPWQGNAESTIAQKGFDWPLIGGKQAGDSGRRTQLLQHMNHAEVADKVLTVGNVMEYSAIQHFGGKAGRGHKVAIPARPFIGLSREDRQMVAEQIGDAIERAVKSK